MSLVNKVILVGNLGQDPEFNDFGEGRTRVKFSLATNESYKDKNGNRAQKTEWHNIVAWGKKAEVINEYLKKGSKIMVEGKLTSRAYENKDGEKRRIMEVHLNSFEFMESKVAEPAF